MTIHLSNGRARPAAIDAPQHDTARGQSDLVAEASRVVGENLRTLRKRQGHSLDTLAKLSSVSRAMLGQIETGKSVPTVTILWKIANALAVSPAQLIAPPERPRAVRFRRDNPQRLNGHAGPYESRVIIPMDARSRHELTEISLAPGHRESFEPAVVPRLTSLVVAKGRLDVKVAGETPMRLSEGDGVLFLGSEPESYFNSGSTIAIAYRVCCPKDAGFIPDR